MALLQCVGELNKRIRYNQLKKTNSVRQECEERVKVKLNKERESERWSHSEAKQENESKVSVHKELSDTRLIIRFSVAEI